MRPRAIARAVIAVTLVACPITLHRWGAASAASSRRGQTTRGGVPQYRERQNQKRRAPPENYLSRKWTDRVLSSNGLEGAAVSLRERGVVYVAVGALAMQKAFRSARSVRLSNSRSDVGVLLVTDSGGKAAALRWGAKVGDSELEHPRDSVFDDVVDVGSSSARLKFGEYTQFEGFKGAASEEVSVNGSFAEANGGGKQALMLKRLRILKVRSLMLGIQLYQTILFLDTDTAVCGPLIALFESLYEGPRVYPDGVGEEHPTRRGPAHVGFVPLAGGRTHDHALVTKIFNVPEGHPEANTGVLVVRNSSASRRLLANWNIAYHVLARGGSNLMDQPAFRVAVFRSTVTYVTLPWTANCRGRDHQRKLALPLACDGYKPAPGAPVVTGDSCVVLHSHDLSIQPARAPHALPNFYTARDAPTAAAGYEPSRFSPRAFDGSPFKADPSQRRRVVEEEAYRTRPAVFVHIPKAAGNSAKELFVKKFLPETRQTRAKARKASGIDSGDAGGDHGKTKAHSLHIDTRREWDHTALAKRRKFSVLYGAFAFGACAGHPVGPCAYYVVMRDPVARIVSEHKYCHECNFTDQTCTGRRGVQHMRTLDVARWAEEKGNFMLEHFLQLSPMDWVDISSDTDASRKYVEWHERDPALRVGPIETRRAREGVATAADLQFVVEHLEDWLAVVGITERFEESMALFAFAFTGELMPHAVAGSVHTHNAGTSVDGLDEETRRRIRDACSLDLELYTAAYAIFERQLLDFKARGLKLAR